MQKQLYGYQIWTGPAAAIEAAAASSRAAAAIPSNKQLTGPNSRKP